MNSIRYPSAIARPVSGFTLVELVTVIVILGVLAASAIPRFVNMQREARIAKVQVEAHPSPAAQNNRLTAFR